jgi:hypothetical protein
MDKCRSLLLPLVSCLSLHSKCPHAHKRQKEAIVRYLKQENKSDDSSMTARLSMSALRLLLDVVQKGDLLLLLSSAGRRRLRRTLLGRSSNTAIHLPVGRFHPPISMQQRRPTVVAFLPSHTLSLTHTLLSPANLFIQLRPLTFRAFLIFC